MAFKSLAQINNIYRQAAVSWNVSNYQGAFDPGAWDDDNDGKLKCGDSQWLSNYNPEMNNIISAFEAANTTDKNTFYLFITENLEGCDGFMPLGRQFGFIQPGTDLPHTIAHELGHGAFRLYHTFSPNSDYLQPQGSTNNLMDYSNGSALYKYQWDYVHDPVRMVRLAQEDEEGMRAEKNSLFATIEINGKFYYFKSGDDLNDTQLQSVKDHIQGLDSLFRIKQNEALLETSFANTYNTLQFFQIKNNDQVKDVNGYILLNNNKIEVLDTSSFKTENDITFSKDGLTNDIPFYTCKAFKKEEISIRFSGDHNYYNQDTIQEVELFEEIALECGFLSESNEWYFGTEEKTWDSNQDEKDNQYTILVDYFKDSVTLQYENNQIDVYLEKIIPDILTVNSLTNPFNPGEGDTLIVNYSCMESWKDSITSAIIEVYGESGLLQFTDNIDLNDTVYYWDGELESEELIDFSVSPIMVKLSGETEQGFVFEDQKSTIINQERDFLEMIHLANAARDTVLDISDFRTYLNSYAEIELKTLEFTNLHISVDNDTTRNLTIITNTIDTVITTHPDNHPGEYLSVRFTARDGENETTHISEIIVERDEFPDLRNYLFGCEDGTVLGDVTNNPAIAPCSGVVSAGRFGCTRYGTYCYYDPSESNTSFHPGVDIYAEIGQNIHSIFRGVVQVGGLVNSFASGEYAANSLGNYVTIRSENPDTNSQYIYIRYCHLDTVLVSENDTIQIGHIIGLGGETGNASGIADESLHTHIEVSFDNVFYASPDRVSVEDYLFTKFDNNGNAIIQEE